jgi:phenylacetate-CoA ligase
VKLTPLESWVQQKISPIELSQLTRSQIEAYQLHKLRETVARIKKESPFYREVLSEFSANDLTNLNSFSRLPFTTPDNVRKSGLEMLSISQDEIARAVTLNTSGTTGEGKRIFFTQEDIDLTIDFFMHGMSTLVERGETVIIFLPGEKRDSVGDLLTRALERLQARPVLHGPIRDAEAARRVIKKHGPACLVGIPTQILSLARGDVMGTIPSMWVLGVLLSTDYVPMAVINALRETWGCRVFAHYGMTEMGLGGGVECEARAGYHMREADLYVEIVSPVTGEPLEDGRYGEVVFTTLTRRGMPLLRYKTGDLSRFLPDPCPCGTVLKRLDRIQSRLGAGIVLEKGLSIRMADLDEALFPIPGVLNYTAEVTDAGGRDQLRLCFYTIKGWEEQVLKGVREALCGCRAIGRVIDSGGLYFGGTTFNDQDWFTTGVRKRRISDKRTRMRPEDV